MTRPQKVASDHFPWLCLSKPHTLIAISPHSFPPHCAPSHCPRTALALAQQSTHDLPARSSPRATGLSLRSHAEASMIRPPEQPLKG
eukprot:scaffold85460_cov48-Phaeocystis_antarctica.AAC.1